MSMKFLENVAEKLGRKVTVKEWFNLSANERTDVLGLECKDESLADQSQAEEADINTIVRRFGVTEMVPVGQEMPVSADFAETFDMQGALNLARQAQESFMALSADVRAQFGNSAAAFSAFASNPDNADQLSRWGMTVKVRKDEPQAVRITNVDDLKPKDDKK